MVRADLLDCVDRFLRLNGPEADKPFGGIGLKKMICDFNVIIRKG